MFESSQPLDPLSLHREPDSVPKNKLRAQNYDFNVLFPFRIRQPRQRVARESVGFAGGVKNPIQRDADMVQRDQAPEVRSAFAKAMADKPAEAIFNQHR